MKRAAWSSGFPEHKPSEMGDQVIRPVPTWKVKVIVKLKFVPTWKVKVIVKLKFVPTWKVKLIVKLKFGQAQAKED